MLGTGDRGRICGAPVKGDTAALYESYSFRPLESRLALEAYVVRKMTNYLIVNPNIAEIQTYSRIQQIGLDCLHKRGWPSRRDEKRAPLQAGPT